MAIEFKTGIETGTNEPPRRRAWAIASGVALATLSACPTSSGELGGIDEDTASTSAGSTGPGLGGSEEGEPTGSEEGGSEGGSEEGGSSGDTGEPITCASSIDVGPSAPRLLTQVQYANTVRDLFGELEGPWTDPTQSPWSLAPTGVARPFDAMVPDGGVVAGYEALAPLVAQAMQPEMLLPCAVDTPDPDSCAETFVPQLGRAVWRRPLTPGEVAALLLHYDGVDLVEGTRAVVEAMLVSPEFYTLREQGTPSAEDAGILALDEHSLATRLSYYLWNSTPDAILLARADAGELSDPMVRAEEAQRLLADPRASAMIGELYAQWLGTRQLDALTNVSDLDPALGTAMETEVRMLAADIVLGTGDGRLATLLQAPYTFLNDGLAALYGADVLATTGTPGPETFVRAELEPDHRGGLMTLPGVMAHYSYDGQVSLAKRGRFVREAWLCQQLPPHPPDTGSLPILADRYEYIASVLAEPACAGCHELLEGPHVAFDNYDILGRWQTEIDGQPVQSNGELHVVSTGVETFADRAELVEDLLALPDTRVCVAQQHLRFALRRGLSEQDSCTVEVLTDELAQTDGDLAELLVTLVTTNAFGHVRPD